NPHATPLQAPVGLNFMADYRHYGSQKTFTLYDDHGAAVASQGHGGHSVVLENSPWNPYLAFVADVAPLAVRRYELRPDSPANISSGPINVKETDAGIDIETRYWTGHFSREHAALSSLV